MFSHYPCVKHVCVHTTCYIIPRRKGNERTDISSREKHQQMPMQIELVRRRGPECKHRLLVSIYRDPWYLYLSRPIVSSCHSSAFVQLFIQSWRRIIFNGGVLARVAFGTCIRCIISAYINAYLACPHAHAHAPWIRLRTALILFYRMHKTWICAVLTTPRRIVDAPQVSNLS